MSHKRLLNAGGRIARPMKPVAYRRSLTWAAPLSNRARGGQLNEKLPFVPPEDWHEPREDGRGYRIVVQPPGEGYRHVLTPDQVRQRLAKLPADFTRSLEVVQLSRMTRKKQGFPCYGMQWGAAIYLYPKSLEERGVQVGVVDFASGLTCKSVPLFIRVNFPW